MNGVALIPGEIARRGSPKSEGNMAPAFIYQRAIRFQNADERSLIANKKAERGSLGLMIFMLVMKPCIS